MGTSEVSNLDSNSTRISLRKLGMQKISDPLISGLEVHLLTYRASNSLFNFSRLVS